jgi:hypothetical protein
MVRVVVATDGKGGLPVPYGIAHTEDEVRKLLEKARQEGLIAMEQPRS